MAPDTAPLTDTLSAVLSAVATAGQDASIVLGEAPFAGVVIGASYTPNGAITGVNSNTRAMRVRNHGQDGSGTTIVAELQFNAGVNAAAYDEKALPLSSTPANLNVAAGDILEAFSDAVGTGMADPGGLLQVEVSRS